MNTEQRALNGVGSNTEGREKRFKRGECGLVCGQLRLFEESCEF